VPRNNFTIAPEAKQHVPLAGGIAVTPLKAVAHQLLADYAEFELQYGARTPRCAQRPSRVGAVQFHFDNDGSGSARHSRPARTGRAGNAWLATASTQSIRLRPVESAPRCT
jgi:ferredoxin-NADP reductase